MTLMFTGSRPKNLFGYHNTQKYNQLLQQIQTICESYIAQHHVTQFVSGGAQGIDQLAFWAVNRCKQVHPELKNIVYRPFPNHESKWAEHGLFSQTAYRNMLATADEVITVCNEFSIQALQLRNNAMIDAADFVLAIAKRAPGTTEPAQGGTRNAFQYALKNNKPIDWLDPFDFSIYHVN